MSLNTPPRNSRRGTGGRLPGSTRWPEPPDVDAAASSLAVRNTPTFVSAGERLPATARDPPPCGLVESERVRSGKRSKRVVEPPELFSKLLRGAEAGRASALANDAGGWRKEELKTARVQASRRARRNARRSTAWQVDDARRDARRSHASVRRRGLTGAAHP
eukprot:3387105-Rhodomonas_salina.1